MSLVKVELTERDLTLISSALDKMVDFPLFESRPTESQRLAIAQRVEQLKEKLFKNNNDDQDKCKCKD